MISKVLKVLIVDDSRVFASAVAAALEGEEGIEVMGTARNGTGALAMIDRDVPDLVTLDLEMPEMDGLQTLEAIMQYNTRHNLEPGIGVIMLSAHTKKGAECTIKALSLGAFDFIAKPVTTDLASGIDALRRSLLPRLHHFASLRTLGTHKRLTAPQATDPRPVVCTTTLGEPYNPSTDPIVVLGVSTGGPKALMDMLPELSNLVKAPVLIVQHMPGQFTQSLAESLAKRCSHRVKEAENGELLDRSTVYIAPGGHHMLLRSPAGTPVLTVNDHPPENGCRPSVDVLFRSIPAAVGANAIAIIMTGMGNDGAQSLRSLKRAGVYIIAQDRLSSVVWGMPGSAVDTGFVDAVVPLMEIPHKVYSVITQKNSPVKQV